MVPQDLPCPPSWAMGRNGSRMKDGEWDFAHSQETLELHPMTLKGLNITADGKQRLTFFFLFSSCVCRSPPISVLYCNQTALPHPAGVLPLILSPAPGGKRGIENGVGTWHPAGSTLHSLRSSALHGGGRTWQFHRITEWVGLEGA